MSKLRYRRLGLQSNQDIVLKYFDKYEVLENITDNNPEYKIAIVDTETTGLNVREDKIIELGYILLELNKSFQVINIIKRFNELNDPKELLSEEVKKVTGITDEELKDKSIDWDSVNLDFKDVDLVIAHNSGFDRPFVERSIKTTRDLNWSCSLREIPWDSWNFPRQKLEALCEYHGFYFIGHRAINDCEALLNLLTIKTPDENESYLSLILKKYKEPSYFIAVKNTPFETKTIFNSLGFFWEANYKFWFKYYDSESEKNVAEEVLNKSLARYKSTVIESVTINSKRKYKDVSILAKIKDDNKAVLSINDKLKTSKPLILIAKNTEYAQKDKLKKRGYFWSNNLKSWYLYVDEKEAELEKDWLRANIYPNKLFKGSVVNNKNFKK